MDNNWIGGTLKIPLKTFSENLSLQLTNSSNLATYWLIKRQKSVYLKLRFDAISQKWLTKTHISNSPLEKSAKTECYKHSL